MAELPFQPNVLMAEKPELQKVEFTREFLNPTAGTNFSFGLGLGVGLELRNRSQQPIEISKPVMLRITHFELEFLGKTRNKDITS